MNCKYCGGDKFNAEGRCTGCSAQGVKTGAASTSCQGFFWNGHWVVVERDYGGGFGWDTETYYFYLGPQLMAAVPIEREMLQELFPPTQMASVAVGSPDPRKVFIWELYLLAVGEQREYVLEWVERNLTVRRARFAVTLAPKVGDEREYFPGLTLVGLAALRDQVAQDWRALCAV